MRDMASTAEAINYNFNITGLFGIHEDTAQAALTHIAPVTNSSIVFKEGVLDNYHRAVERMTLFEPVADIRLSLGCYDQFGNTAVQALLADTKEGVGSHNIYSFTKLQTLFSKNCLVYLADYVNVDNDDLSAYSPYLQESKQLWSNFENAITVYEKELTVKGLWRLFTTRAAHDHMREVAAVKTVLNRLAKLTQIDLTSFTTGNDGRVETYLVYGLGHQESLTSKFHEAGLEFTDVALDDKSKYHAWNFVSNMAKVDYESFRSVMLKNAQS